MYDIMYDVIYKSMILYKLQDIITIWTISFFLDNIMDDIVSDINTETMISV